jgi:hypothetical protein
MMSEHPPMTEDFPGLQILQSVDEAQEKQSLAQGWACARIPLS